MKISAIKNIVTTKKIKTLAPALVLGAAASTVSSAASLKNNSQYQLTSQQLQQKHIVNKSSSEHASMGLSGALALSGLAFFVGTSLLAEKNRKDKEGM